MNTQQTAQQPLPTEEGKLLALVGAMIDRHGAWEADDHRPTPGHWDGVMRAALGLVSGAYRWSMELNPQPLPPRVAILVAVAQVVIDRADLLQEIADASTGAPTSDFGGFVTRFTDDWCTVGYRLRFPFPWPRPPWFVDHLDAFDLLVLAAQFARGAKETFSTDLRRHLDDASAAFVKAGIDRMR